MYASLPATIGFLPRSQQALLAELIQKIVTAVLPEKIICYGIRSSHYQDWGCFLGNKNVQENARLCFDLLIVASSAKGSTEQDISQIAEQQCKPLADASCITHKIHTVNDGLAKGNPFFCTLYHHGMFVYDSGQTALLNPGPSENAVVDRHNIEGIWARWYGLASNFYKCAVDSMGYGRPDLTTFMLHQAVEHTCSALIRVFTGYRPNTHNLTRLMMLVESFTREFSKVFPRITREEEEIYNILQRGYLDARYKDDYDVPSTALKLLIDRVERLQIIAASLYAERLSMNTQPELGSLSLTLPGSPALP